jgi:hypothetical protein
MADCCYAEDMEMNDYTPSLADETEETSLADETEETYDHYMSQAFEELAQTGKIVRFDVPVYDHPKFSLIVKVAMEMWRREMLRPDPMPWLHPPFGAVDSSTTVSKFL